MPRLSVCTIALAGFALAPLHAAASEPHTESASALLADLRQPVGLLSNTSLTLAPSALAHRSDLQPGQGLLGGQSFGRDAMGSDPGNPQPLFWGSVWNWWNNWFRPPPPPPGRAQNYQPWMSPEVRDAWSQGYLGQNTTITVVDDFRSGGRFNGNLQGFSQSLTHGEWTAMQAGMIAPSATVRNHDFNQGWVSLRRGLNVINMSYGLMSTGPAPAPGLNWALPSRDFSIALWAQMGRAVAVKAAGNAGVALDGRDFVGRVDLANLALRNSPSVIFVGALSSNGTTSQPAQMALYSNRPGKDTQFQNRFLMVGVEADKIDMAGTSFAAPVVSGYAAILGSKFTRASPSAISNQLLNTARKDTVANYNVEFHGRGEASLSRALAPVSIR